MALVKELLLVLDDENEPLPKRLKIADNAFKTTKLQLQNHEAVLFNWIGTLTKTDEECTWVLLLNWLKSQKVQDLSRNDITLKDINNLISVITNGLGAPTNKNKFAIINCATAVIENRTFQLFFKHDIDNYCAFISQIIEAIDDQCILTDFIQNEKLFSRYIVAAEDFPKSFIKHTLVSLGKILQNFSESKKIFLAASALVEKCLFHRNFKLFSSYFKTLFEDESLDKITLKLPKLLTKTLLAVLNENSSLSVHIYKLVFYSFCTSYINHYNLVYQFFILLTQTLGLDMSSYFNTKKIRKFNNSSCSVNQSVLVLSELCQVLTEFNNDLNHKVKDIPLSEFLKHLVLGIITVVKEPNQSVYKFLNCVIIIDPLITEQILNDILVYVMLSNKLSTELEYEKFLIAVFEVFVKLHRIPNLISKMIPTLKSTFEGNFQNSPSIINYSGQLDKQPPKFSTAGILPQKVLDYFLFCITTFASWQAINLFKTLLYHFEYAVNDLSAVCEVDTKFVYVDVISSLIGQFLCSVRIAEHTATAGSVEKFVKCMEDLRKMLKTFGTTLVKMEHNPSLMKSYLNICHAWGELYLTLAYYSNAGEVDLMKSLDSDVAACNITYLHSYLSRDQWRLLSQRITNFGEKPCKLIMNKLYTQKLKALKLFEPAISEDILTSIKTNLLLSVEDNWRDLICDKVILKQIISNPHCKPIAELLVQDLIETQHFNELTLVYDNYDLICMIIYTSISKINKIFKRQYKTNHLDTKTLLTSLIISHITEELFNSKEGDLVNVYEAFNIGVMEMDSSDVSCTFGDTQLASYIALIKNIPVCQYDNARIEGILFLFLTTVFLELHRNSSENTHLINECECIIMGIAQNYSGSFKTLFAEKTLEVIINGFARYKNLFEHIIHNIFKVEDNYMCLKEGIDFLTKNVKQERYLQCVLIILKHINKYKKYKISIEKKELLMDYQELIFKAILHLIQKDKKQMDLTEAYALLLKHKFSKETGEEITELLLFVDKYIDRIVANTRQTKGSLLLFTTLLRNKTKTKISTDDLSLKAWNYCRSLANKSDEELAELVVLIIEHIPNEQFSSIINCLLRDTTLALQQNDYKKFIDELDIWNIILTSSLNPIKTHQWQSRLEELLLQHVLPYFSNHDDLKECSLYDHIVKFEINIIQRAQLPLTALLIDAIFLTISIMASKQQNLFQSTFVSSVMILQMLLKFRKSQMMDYLPVYLQRYRILLNMLCNKSNAELKFDLGEEQQISDCAHKLEKLTNSLVLCNKHLMRIAPYLITDILKHYEEVTLLPNVKLHLNNCLYSLMSLCDEHAVSYVMRISSTASTEMFKVIYENYKKYYKFTGRV